MYTYIALMPLALLMIRWYNMLMAWQLTNMFNNH